MQYTHQQTMDSSNIGYASFGIPEGIKGKEKKEYPEL